MATLYAPNSAYRQAATSLEEAGGGMSVDGVQRLEADPRVGMLAHSASHILPRKGWTDPQAAVHNNMMKAVIMFILQAFFTFRPTRGWMESTLRRFVLLGRRIYFSEVPSGENACPTCGNSARLVRPDFLRPQFMTPVGRELWVGANNFLRAMRMEAYLAYDGGMILAHLFEYEEPYRFQLQDFLMILNWSRLATSPILELWRGLAEFRRRNHSHGEQGMANKFTWGVAVLALALFIPAVRRAFRIAVREFDHEAARLDVYDKYYCLLRPDYDYLGQPLEQRRTMFTDLCRFMGFAVVFQD